MTSLSSIVDVQIDKLTKVPTRVGFGTILIMDENTVQAADDVEIYENLEDILSAGFVVTDEAYLAARAAFSQSPRPEKVVIARREIAEAMATAIARVNEIDSDWYFLISTSRVEADILSAGATIEAMLKTYFYETDEADSKDLAHATDTTSIFAQMKIYERSVGIYTKTANLDSYPAAAWCGRLGPKDPGSVTWKFKSLSGVTPDDELNSTERANVLGKNANLYLTVAGQAITMEGTSGTGEFIDIVRGIDWLTRRIKEDVYFMLINEDKVPYTDKGGDALGLQVKGPLDEAVAVGLLAGGDEAPVVTVPLVADIPQIQRAAREFGDIEFEGRLAGAVHKVIVRGRVTV